MKARTVVAVLCLAIGLAWAAPTAAQPTAAPTGPDTKAIAAQLVKQIAQVKPGEVVFLGGDVRDLALVEDIFIEVRKQGGVGLMLLEREVLNRRHFDDVPEPHDGNQAALWLKLWPLAAVEIAVEGEEFPGLLKHVPPARRAASAKKWEPVNKQLAKLKLRRVFLGNGLYPTAATAKQFGLTKEQLAKIFWDGVAVAPARVQAAAEGARAVLAKGKVLQLTHPNGTALKLRIAARPVLTSDGVISEAKMKKGGAAAWTWLPAGEVYTTPVPRSAEGKVVVDRFVWEDGEVQGLTVTFKAGKVTSMTAKPSVFYDRFKARYDAATGRKDELGMIDVGVNPAVSIPQGSKLLTYVAAGIVTVTIGGNTFAGGDNPVGYAAVWHMPGSTLLVDGKPLVDKGQLKVPGLTTASR